MKRNERNKWKLIYNKRNRKYRFIRNMMRKQAGLDEYAFYSILNTDIIMELGVAASMVRIKMIIKTW